MFAENLKENPVAPQRRACLIILQIFACKCLGDVLRCHFAGYWNSSLHWHENGTSRTAHFKGTLALSWWAEKAVDTIIYTWLLKKN